MLAVVSGESATHAVERRALKVQEYESELSCSLRLLTQLEHDYSKANSILRRVESEIQALERHLKIQAVTGAFVEF